MTSDANKTMLGEAGIGDDFPAPATSPLVQIMYYSGEMWQESET